MTSLVLVFATVMALPAAMDSLKASDAISETAGKLYGHVIIKAVTGNYVQYVQSDNTIMDEGLNKIGAQVYGAAADPFNRIELNSEDIAAEGSVPLVRGDVVTMDFSNTGQITGTFSHIDNVADSTCSTAGTETCEEVENTGGTTIDAADPSIIKAVSLSNAAGEAISFVDLTSAINVVPGSTVVTITYLMKHSG